MTEHPETRTSPVPALEAARRGQRAGTGGPPLWAPALAYAALTIGAVALHATPPPSAGAQALLAAQQANATSAQVAAFLLFGSAFPLAVWTAATYQRMRGLGVLVAGPVIGLVGGLLASTSIALSGLISWTAVEVAPLGDGALAQALATLGFLTGAAGFIMPFGLAVAGVAVPALIIRLLPRVVAIIGLLLAVLGVLSYLTVIAPVLSPVLPLVRFGGLIWLVVASFQLPRARAAQS